MFVRVCNAGRPKCAPVAPKAILSNMPDSHAICHPEDTYFLTLTVMDWMDVFSRRELRLILTDNLTYCIQNKGLIVHAWVVMTNHMHLIASAKEGHHMGHILRDYKKFTSKAIRRWVEEERESRKRWLLDIMAFQARRTGRAREYKLWQDGSHAIPIRSLQMMQRVMDYIHHNPVKAMVVDRPEDYVFSSARVYATGEAGLIAVEPV